MSSRLKFLWFLIPLTALALTVYYPGRTLMYDIQLQNDGVKTTALCFFHEWQEDVEGDPEVVQVTYTETAYPKVAFKHEDSTYLVDIDPYLYEHSDGTTGYLTTGESVEIIYFPDDPTKRVVAVNSNSFFWLPLIYFILALSVTAALFVWIISALKD